MQMLSPLPLSSSSNAFDQPTFTLEEACSTVTHLALAFLPRQLTYIVAPILTGIGILKIFSSPETGKERENNLTRFIAHLSPISADLIALYDLCLGAYHLISGIKDLLYQENDKSLLPGIKNILISGITLFADYRFAMRCYKKYETKVTKMELTLKTTTQNLDRTSRALTQTISDFKALRGQDALTISQLARKLAATKIALEKSGRAAKKNLQNSRETQKAIEIKCDDFARSNAAYYNALQLAEWRMGELSKRLSTLSDRMASLQKKNDSMEGKNRKLEFLAILLAKALQKKKSLRQKRLVLESEHLAALQRNILKEAKLNSLGTISANFSPIRLREVDLKKLNAAYDRTNGILQLPC